MRLFQVALGITLGIIILYIGNVQAQNQPFAAEFKGHVICKEDGLPISFANIHLPEQQKGTLTDSLGFFELGGFPGTGRTIEEELKEAVATIGENINLRRVAKLDVPGGVVASYVHNQVAPGLGKIGVLVGIQAEGDADKAGQFGRQVAMHVAAASPLALRVEDLDKAVVDRERAVYAEEARESGKPEGIIDKMVEGKLRKFYQESVLLSQVFVIDPDLSVEAAMKKAEGDTGGKVELAGFITFRLGEGVEREETDFAAEVAAAAGN